MSVDMSKEEIKAIEEAYAKTETPVVSNNSAHRWTPDVGNDGKEIYKYETETEKISSVVGAGELKKITAATEIELVIEGEHEGTVLFRILPENELYVKKGTEILRTGLSERLPEEAAWLSGIRSIKFMAVLEGRKIKF